MSDEALMQFKSEGQPLFDANREKENSPAPSAEITDANPNPSSGGEPNPDANKGGGDPGSRDPKSGLNNPTVERWQERESDWKNRFNDQESRHLQDLTKMREDFDAKLAALSQTPAASSEVVGEPPAWFGGDAEQWAGFQQWNNSLISKAKTEARTEALNEIKSKSDAEQKAIDESTRYMNDQVAEIESDKAINPEGVKVDRNKLLNFALENELVDTKGRWNYKAAFKMMKASDVFKTKEAIDEKKKIASASTSDRRAETKPPAYMTSADFQKSDARPW